MSLKGLGSTIVEMVPLTWPGCNGFSVATSWVQGIRVVGVDGDRVGSIMELCRSEAGFEGPYMLMGDCVLKGWFNTLPGCHGRPFIYRPMASGAVTKSYHSATVSESDSVLKTQQESCISWHDASLKAAVGSSVGGFP